MKDAAAEVNIAAWVALASPNRRAFREAVHVTLSAIGSSRELSSQMIMKGGILLAIRYQNSRFTRDIDFSTREKYATGKEDRIATTIREALIVTGERLGYDTVCRLQGHELRPPQAREPTFPTLKMKVGYASQSNHRAFARLRAGASADLVELDFSFNEAVLHVDQISLSDGGELIVYSFLNVVAEKFRSLIQQPTRNRNRRQDVYDLHYVLTRCAKFTDDERRDLLLTLIQSCEEREVSATQSTLDAPAIRSMAEAEYATLADDIEGSLPNFDEAFAIVREFYLALPWQLLTPLSPSPTGQSHEVA